MKYLTLDEKIMFISYGFIAFCLIVMIIYLFHNELLKDKIEQKRKKKSEISVKDINKYIKKKIEKSNKKYVYHDIKLTKKLYKRYNKNN